MTSKKEKDRDTIQKEFLEHVWDTIAWWEHEDRAITARDKLSGLAFSILSTLDGCAAMLPGFIVAPNPHPSDKEYHMEQKEAYYPQAPEVPCDIGGNLHERFYDLDPQKFSAKS